MIGVHLASLPDLAETMTITVEFLVLFQGHEESGIVKLKVIISCSDPIECRFSTARFMHKMLFATLVCV